MFLSSSALLFLLACAMRAPPITQRSALTKIAVSFRPAIVQMCCTRAMNIEVLSDRAGPVLSDQAVAHVLELVYRDTSMLFKTAVQRPLPVVWGLLQERLPMARWYCNFKYYQWRLAANRALTNCSIYRQIAPRSPLDLKKERGRLQFRLDKHRSTLWPTLRALLLRPSTHQRVLQAARTQVAQYRADSPRGYRRLLRAPRRLFSLWLALIRSGGYGLRWLLVSLPGPLWLFSAAKRQQVRADLIERALLHGLALQRRIEALEVLENTRRLLTSSRTIGLPEQSVPNSTALSRLQHPFRLQTCLCLWRPFRLWTGTRAKLPK